MPGHALQSLRRAMSRHAGVLRHRTGLEQLRGEIADLIRIHGPALPLVAARLIALSQDDKAAQIVRRRTAAAA